MSTVDQSMSGNGRTAGRGTGQGEVVGQVPDVGRTPWLDRYAQSLMGTYGVPQQVLVRGDGAYVWDVEGRRYLDLLGGIATNALGHAHPALVGAVAVQLATLGHISNFFASRPQIELAERLLGLLDAPAGSRVFFASSGGEANEGAFKIARRTGRPRILAVEGAFHGRSMGALALTHKAAYRDPFAPLPPGVEHLPFGDLDALREAVDDQVAALVLEPIQGEAGVRPHPPGYLEAARELTAAHGALLVLDEVQTGMGRTGAWFAHTRHGVRPDVVTLAKGLGGGIPIGAVVALGEPAGSMLGRGQHGTTFGGNPVSCAAALAVMAVIDQDGVLENVRVVGADLRSAVMGTRHPLLDEITGEGLLLGIRLTAPVAAQVVVEAMSAGFVVNAANPTTVRLAPPLLLTVEQGRSFAAALPAILDRCLPEPSRAPDPASSTRSLTGP